MERKGKVLRFDEISRSGRIVADDEGEEFNFYSHQIGQGSGNLVTDTNVTYERSVNEKGESVYSNIRTEGSIDFSNIATNRPSY